MLLGLECIETNMKRVGPTKPARRHMQERQDYDDHHSAPSDRRREDALCRL